MSERRTEQANYWMTVFQALVESNHERKRLPREEIITIPCPHCKGSITIAVRYMGDIWEVDAHCFDSECQFPYLQGSVSMGEVYDETHLEIVAAKRASISRDLMILGLDGLK